ncbi:hypothetical protein ONZ51_g11403 [Trametes cubensis]|uniref:Uncharacterized protein n=1 Tax=Trametes cubensis TaxID=1111947 RepID=A0AAD7X7W5_9APHY|nr:hypothetical protein ONZ51_g11403 [Trametes cubensis]
MVKRDAQRFPPRGAEVPPMSRDDISASLGMVQTELPDDEHGFQEPDGADQAVMNEQVANTGHEGEEVRRDDGEYDGDVDLNNLGDIGSTAN